MWLPKSYDEKVLYRVGDNEVLEGSDLTYNKYILLELSPFVADMISVIVTKIPL